MATKRILLGNVKGPKGDEGPRGIQGEKGETGETGPVPGPTDLYKGAHPVGDLIANTTGADPGALYGGTWARVPSAAAHVWRRTQ